MIRNTEEIIAKLKSGYHLCHRSVGWGIQHGKPGEGGVADQVHASRAQFLISSGKLRNVGSKWKPVYVWAGE